MQLNHTVSENLSETSSVYNILHPTLTEPTQSLPFKEGFLLKRTTGLFRRWTCRYFVLENSELKYYYDSSRSKLGGVLNFNVITADIQLKSKEFHIIALGTNRTFRFKAKNEQSAIDWGYSISLTIALSKGKKRILHLHRKAVYWKHSLIGQKEFIQSARTGDILLFKGTGFSSRFQRIITSSVYDHIALILKYGKERVSFLQATSVGGVEIIYWDEFLHSQTIHPVEQVALRKLDFDRSPSVLSQLEEFINIVLGKKFRLSTSKLFARRKDKHPQEKRGFFCSELVAMAYKIIGVLPDKPPASRYWPGDFYDNKKLNLINGAYFKQSLIIDFDIE